MSAATRLESRNRNQTKLTQKLMVNGFVCPESTCALSVEVKRGMTIWSKDGLDVGKLAAVVLNSENRKATHILLSRLPEMKGYWMIPVDFIAAVHGEEVQLTLQDTAIETMPQWHPE